MKKFNYTDWVIKNKHGKTLKENQEFTPDLEKDALQRAKIRQMIAKEKGERDKGITGMEDVNEEENFNEMKVTDKDGKDVTSDVIKAIEKRLEKKYKMKFTKGYTSDPELRRDDPRYTKAEIAGMEDSENDPKDDWTPEDEEEQVRYDKGWYGESLKEAASKLGYLKNEQSKRNS